MLFHYDVSNFLRGMKTSVYYCFTMFNMVPFIENDNMQKYVNFASRLDLDCS
jgi:hypothetical protein